MFFLKSLNVAITKLMRIHFIGIGGAGIGPLAIVAKKARYEVSGSDLQSSEIIDYLNYHDIKDIFIGDNLIGVKKYHALKKLDWIVYSSALSVIGKDLEIIQFAKAHGIRISKRDKFLNEILAIKKLDLIAIAGTHGKTTTTAMLVWLFKCFNLPISYLLPAKTNFADLGDYRSDSKYFIYEADEFDNNFLSFNPAISIIPGVSYDHHEIFKTREDYKDAFRKFISQSSRVILYHEDANYLTLKQSDNLEIISVENSLIDSIKLNGKYNRQDAYLVSKLFSQLTGYLETNVIKVISQFPGLYRRMEALQPNLYTDYAHTPEKIKAALNTASEMVKDSHQKIIVIYEPLTNRRQKYIKDQYKDTFKDADKLYWIDSYLAREDPNDPIIKPSELIKTISNPKIAEAKTRNQELYILIKDHLKKGDFVLAISGGGGNGLDEWLRKIFLSTKA